MLQQTLHKRKHVNAKKHMKKYLRSFALSKCKLTPQGDTTTHLLRTKTKNIATNPKCGWEYKTVQPLWKTVWQLLLN